MPKQNVLYLACSWFSQEEKQHLKQAQQQLAQNPTVDWDNSFRPLEHQFGDYDVSHNPAALADPLWQMGTFRNDLTGINKADLVCGLFIPEKPDTGMAFEFGYTYACHKPIFAVIPDNSTVSINVMLVPSVTKYIRLRDAATFDFNNYDFDLFPVSTF